jgi:hypothetical protein
MGQCGCGDMNLRYVHRIEKTPVTLGIDTYFGCDGCETPLGVVVMVFDPAGVKEWVDHFAWTPTETVQADEYGGNDGRGIVIPFIGREDLMAACNDEDLSDIELDEYGSLKDVLDQYGLRLLRAAWDHRLKAFDAERKRWRERTDAAANRTTDGAPPAPSANAPAGGEGREL